MSAFKSETLIPISVPDLNPVAQELADHFKQRNYQVTCIQATDTEWQVDITRGGVFKTVVGLKSAMKVQLEARPRGTMVRAGVGIFGKQAVPTAITLVIAWPVILPQIWGLIREAGLDNEAVRVVEVILTRTQRLGHPGDDAVGPDQARGQAAPTQNAAFAAAEASTSAAASAGPGGSASSESFCTGCGTPLEASARFCPACGHARAI